MVFFIFTLIKTLFMLRLLSTQICTDEFRWNPSAFSLFEYIINFMMGWVIISAKIKFFIAYSDNIFYITQENSEYLSTTFAFKQNKSFKLLECSKCRKSLSTNKCSKQLIWKFVHFEVSKLIQANLISFDSMTIIYVLRVRMPVGVPTIFRNSFIVLKPDQKLPEIATHKYLFSMLKICLD